MRKYLRKIFAVTGLCCILGFPVMVFASSYSTSFSFNTSVTGPTRSYSGSNITLKTVSSSSGSGTASSNSFSVALYRKNTIGSTYIGTYNFSRNGTSTNTWKSVGSGNYYFYLSKGNDGHTVKGTASMYN